MHRPVGAVGHGELAGSVEGVDDPDSVGFQACVVIGCLLRQDRVRWAEFGQFGQQELVGPQVACAPHVVGALGSDLQQQGSCLSGDVGGQLCVVGGHRDIIAFVGVSRFHRRSSWVNNFTSGFGSAILVLPENDWKGVREMAKFVAERMITRNIAAVGVVGSMTFCAIDPECGILVVPSSVGDSVRDVRWG